MAVNKPAAKPNGDYEIIGHSCEYIYRRQLAFVTDYLLWLMMGRIILVWSGFQDFAKWRAAAGKELLLSIAIYMAWRLLFLFKDGFRGRSPGKLLAGLRVVDIGSGVPIGLMKSFQRNLLLLAPIAGELTIFFVMSLGFRPFDGWANCRVVLDEEESETDN